VQETRVQSLGREDPLEKEGNGNPLQCSCLGNPMNRGTWWARVHGSQRVRHGTHTHTQDVDQRLPHSDTTLVSAVPAAAHCTFQGHVCTVITGHPASGILESLLSEGMKDTWTPMWNWPGNRASHVDTGPMAAQMIQAFGFHCQRLDLEYTREGLSSCSRGRSGRSVCVLHRRWPPLAVQP